MKKILTIVAFWVVAVIAALAFPIGSAVVEAQVPGGAGGPTCYTGTAAQWLTQYGGVLSGYPLCPSGVLSETPTAVTGNGATHYAATSVTAGTANTISANPATLYEILISWSVPSSTGVCYVTVYNSASPTVGTGFVEIIPFNSGTPGIIAVDPPPTVGGAYTTAISYAITTTPTGSTACNTTASELYVEAWYK